MECPFNGTALAARRRIGWKSVRKIAWRCVLPAFSAYKNMPPKRRRIAGAFESFAQSNSSDFRQKKRKAVFAWMAETPGQKWELPEANFPGWDFPTQMKRWMAPFLEWAFGCAHPTEPAFAVFGSFILSLEAGVFKPIWQIPDAPPASVSARFWGNAEEPEWS